MGLLCRAEVGSRGQNSRLLSASFRPSQKKLVPLDSMQGKMEKVLPTLLSVRLVQQEPGCPGATILFSVISLVPPGISRQPEPSFLFSLWQGLSPIPSLLSNLRGRSTFS